MKRNIPNNTQYFQYYNANPRDLSTCDCYIRALATSLNKSWEDVFKELSAIAFKAKRSCGDSWVISKYLENQGAVSLPQPKKLNGKKYTGEEICKLIQEGKFIDNDGVVLDFDNYFINIGSSHCSCVIKGVLKDIWNCSYDKVGKIWGIKNNFSI